MRQFLLSIFISTLFFSCHIDRKLRIAIQPYGKFNPELIDSIKNSLQTIYKAKAYVYDPKPLPASAFTTVKTPRYRADILISLLRQDKPDSIDYILGLTRADISTTKRDHTGIVKKPESKYSDWGIFGLGYRPGPSAIVSTFRIQSTNHSRFLERLKKICVHEVGHNLGLSHCTSSNTCVMKDAAESIKTIDFVQSSLCQVCISRLDHR